MSYLTENPGLPFPITKTDRQQALEFAKQQVIKDKAEQIYRNTLAVLVVEHYLRMLGIEADRSESYSWDAITQLTSNTADLYIPKAGGRLECRPIKTGEKKCAIPPELLDEETWSDRIGLVVVELNETFTVGTLIGFTSQVTVEELPLSYLRSLDDLIDQIDEWSKKIVASAQPSTVDVSEWFRGRFGQRWKSFAEVVQQFALNQPQLVYRFRPSEQGEHRNVDNAQRAELINTIRTTRSEEIRWQAADQLWEIDPEHTDCGVSRVNVLEEFAHPIGLSMGCLRKADNTLSVFSRVYSLNIEKPLPADIELSLIDESGEVLYTAKPSPQNAVIQKKFSVNPDERFKVRVNQGDVVFEQEFFASSDGLLD